MLEKIGLPAKPSLRGSNWVVDASHCQGCSSQFTFINRKHHCRRCGGLFCGSCTQHRMILRGQGDSPVRICEPCKQLEEAARFEMRHGHRSRAGRGGSQLESKEEDEILRQFLSEDKKSSSARESTIKAFSGIKRATRSASSSNARGGEDGAEEKLRSLCVVEPNLALGELASASPEELRQQALDEKKRYKVLKGEGKSGEALKAFKRGKELERKAGALELLLRKNHRKSSTKAEIQRPKDVSNNSGGKNSLSSQLGNEKDDVLAELRELGWSDAEIHDGDKNPGNVSLEGELSNLMKESSQKTNLNKETTGIDKTPVIVLKKRALMLKREGRLAEAKEELKRAKVLEKQLEEQEFFLGADDSDDEIYSLIQGMDDDGQNIQSIQYDLEPDFDYNHLVGVADDYGTCNFDVTDEEMNDPEMAAALHSLGWTDDSNNREELEHATEDEVLSEIQSLKREAVNQKRAGNVSEAVQLLKKAKLLEGDLDNSPSKRNTLVADVPESVKKTAAKSKLAIQRELLGLKKKALALRREGKLDEAEEELKKGKILEQQLEEMDNSSNGKAIPVSSSNSTHSMDIVDNIGEEAVTDQDMRDPTYLAFLSSLGWQEDNDVESTINVSRKSETVPISHTPSTTQIDTPRRSRAELQRELLDLKRKALGLRRQGYIEGVEETLNMAKMLEAKMAELEEPNKNITAELLEDYETITPSVGNALHEEDIVSVPKILERISEEVKPEANSIQKSVSQDSQSSLQVEILVHKKKALTLKREGKLAEAREELRQAKLLERSRVESNPYLDSNSNSSPEHGPITVDAPVPTSIVPIVSGQGDNGLSDVALKPLSARDRFKLQQESLGHKRQALKLRREGRTDEADAEFELAKALEARLEESVSHDSAKSNASSGDPASDDLGVEDFLDPQLLSSLKALGSGDVDTGPHDLERPVPSEHNNNIASKGEDSGQERARLVERIKAEKVEAVKLKRLGKQAEALDALRQAKVLEKRLNSLATR